MPGYYVEEDSNSSMDTYPPSPRFGGDYAVLELDDTHEFVTPAVVGEPQAVPAKEAESEFPQDEEDDWSNDGVLSQVIDMQNLVEQRQQEEQLLRHLLERTCWSIFYFLLNKSTALAFGVWEWQI